jgi:hypothetical protein
MLTKPEEIQKSTNFLNRNRTTLAVSAKQLAFIGCLSWGLGATLLSHFIVGLLF